MKKRIIITSLLFMAFSIAFSFAYTQKEVVEFATSYKPYQDRPNTIAEISSIYIAAVFNNPKVKGIECTKVDDSTYKVTITAFVGDPKPEFLQDTHIIIQRDIEKAKGEFSLEWLVDMKNNRVTPSTYLEQDCFTLYEDMCGMLGVSPKRK